MHKPTAILTTMMSRLSAVIIVLLPFHAFLTVWGASLLGHYTLLRLWKEVVLLGLVSGALVVLVRRPDIRFRWWNDRLTRLIAGYLLLLVLMGLVALVSGSVSHKALAYGILLDGRFLVFFVVTWLVTLQDDLLIRWWKQLLLVPAAIVVGFATVQYALLPHDFLRHFGYGPAAIQPTETVDQKSAYTRIFSTLRGANPLGAYLVVILSAFGVLLVRRRRPALAGIALVLSGGALFFTFSRSAWLGTLLALGCIIWLSISSEKYHKLILLAGCVAVLIAGAVGYGLRGNDRFQNVFLHTSSHSLSVKSSNQGHFSAMKDGLADIVHQPLGMGPGSAGPASFYNPGNVRIAENYYIQVGQELGIIGLLLFLSINVVVGLRLLKDRQRTLSLILFVSFIGLVAVNMLSHAWTDDTLAYIWWGLPEQLCRDDQHT